MTFRLCRVLAHATLLSAAATLLTACESTPTSASGAAPAAAQAATAAPKCEKREVTGSRMARCDDGTRARDVNVISGESIRATGMPSSGAGGAPSN